MLLFTKRLIAYTMAGDFDHYSDHQPILSKWTMRTINNLLNLQLLLNKMDISVPKKTLIEELAKDPSHTFITPNKLDIKNHFLIKAIDIAISFAILKAKLSPKSVPRFDEEYKEL